LVCVIGVVSVGVSYKYIRTIEHSSVVLISGSNRVDDVYDVENRDAFLNLNVTGGNLGRNLLQISTGKRRNFSPHVKIKRMPGSSMSSSPSEVSKVPSALSDADDSNEIKKAFTTESFLIRDELILHRGDRVTKSTRTPPFTKGVLFGIALAGGGVKGASELEKSRAKYIQEVYESAKQLHQVRSDETGTALIIDFGLDVLPPNVVALFDYIVLNTFTSGSASVLDNKPLGWSSKVSNMLFSPFEHTLYVDADTRFCDDPQEILAELRHADVIANKEARDALYTTQSPMINGGVIGFRKTSKAAALIYAVIRLTFGKSVGDQPQWGYVAMSGRISGLRFHLMPLRFHFQHCREQHSACVVSGKVILFHGRVWSQMLEGKCRLLNKVTTTRIFQLLPDGPPHLNILEPHQRHTWHLEPIQM